MLMENASIIRSLANLGIFGMVITVHFILIPVQREQDGQALIVFRMGCAPKVIICHKKASVMLCLKSVLLSLFGLGTPALDLANARMAPTKAMISVCP